MRRLVPIYMLTLLFFGCGPTRSVDRTRPTGPVDGRDAHSFRQAVADFDAGRDVVARRQFEALLLRTRGRPLQPQVRYYLAKLTAKKDPIRGGHKLFEIADAPGPNDLTALADVEGAMLWAQAKQCAGVAMRMDRRLSKLGGAPRVQAIEAMTLCRPDERSLSMIQRVVEADPEQRHALEASTVRVANGLSLEALAKAVEAHQSSPLGPLLRARLAARAGEAGRADLLATPQGSAAPADSSEPSTPPEVGLTGSHRVAVLLPLSGRSKRLGARLEQLVSALYGDEDRPTDAPAVTVHDIGDGQIDAVLTSAAKHAIAVVGLFDRSTAQQAATTAARLNIPLLMLTTADVAVQTKGPIWRVLHTPLLVARTAAGAALGRGGHRAAILYQEGGYGRTLGRWFGEAWRAGGGTVVDTLTWKAKEKNFGRIAKKARRLKADTYFIPTPPAVAARLLSHMAAEKIFAHRPAKKNAEAGDAKYAVIVGPPEWYDPVLLRQGGRYAEGVLIPVPFALETAGGADLTERLGARLGHPPGTFEGLLADSLRAVQLAAARAAEDDQPLAEVLKSMHFENGFTAGLHFDTPEALRALFLIEVVRGAFEPTQ